MATLEQIANALRKADAAGNVDDARTLAAEYRRMQALETPIDTSGMTQLKGKVSDLRRPSLADEAMSFGRGVIEGIPVVGPALSDARRALDANIMSALHGGEAGQYQEQFKDADEALRAKTGGARFAGNVGGAVAGLAPLGMTGVGARLLGMSGSLPARIGTGFASGASISAADTLARGGDLADAGISGGIGGAIGGAIPVVGAGIRRAISPLPANAAKGQAADVLRREGVELTAGQRSGSKGMQYAEAELGGSAVGDFMDRQADQFTAAALRRAGVRANRATPDVMQKAADDIGAKMDDLAARNPVSADRQLGADLKAAFDDYHNLTGNQAKPIFDNLLADIFERLNKGNGVLQGADYKALRSRIEAMARKTGDHELAGALRDMKVALDDAAERWIAQNNPADLGVWREARQEYRNLLVLEDAVSRAGEKAADGIITPQALRGAAIRQNKRAFARGRNDFTDLANAGVSTMTPLPQSGTAPRAAVNAIKAAAPFIGAALAGGGTLGPGAIAGAAAGAVAPWALGRAILSGPGRAYLGNQVASQLPLLPVAPALPALLATRR